MGNRAAEAEVALRGISLTLVALTLIAIGVAVRRVGAAAAVEHAGNAQAVAAALDVGNRGDAHRHGRVIALIAVTIAAGIAIALGVGVAAVLGIGLGDGGGRAPLDREAMVGLVAVAVQLIEDLADDALAVVRVL
jgi:hypothetical protein